MRILAVGASILIIAGLWTWTVGASFTVPLPAPTDGVWPKLITGVLVFAAGIGLVFFLWWLAARFFSLIDKDKIDSSGMAPLDGELVSAIACKETAPVWLQWINQLAPPSLLARCVFDASGDYPGTARRAFPTNTAAFRAEYGDQLTDELIADANETRRLRGYGNQPWIYKGYGIFQYDLQHIKEDPAFFKQKLWCGFDACLDRFMREMNRKLAAADGDLADAVRRYNGSGAAAEQYRDQVMAMRDWLLAAR